MQLFKIARIPSTRYPPIYILKDLDDEEIGGNFYEKELSRVRENLDEVTVKIDKSLKIRGLGLEEIFC